MKVDFIITHRKVELMNTKSLPDFAGYDSFRDALHIAESRIKDLRVPLDKTSITLSFRELLNPFKEEKRRTKSTKYSNVLRNGQAYENKELQTSCVDIKAKDK